MKRSIKIEVLISHFAVLFLTIGLILLANGVGLERYYMHQKRAAIHDAYECVLHAKNDAVYESTEFDTQLQKICGKNNLAVLVIDEKSSVVKASSYNDTMLMNQLYDNLFHIESGIGNRDDLAESVIESKDGYTIRKVTDRYNQSDYLEMWGVLENGWIYLIRTPMDAIADAVSISNRMLVVVAMIVMLCSILLALPLSKRIASPIEELTRVSIRMKQLDFGARYAGKTHNEIALLGENINELSGILQKTISELKTANLELHKDLDRREEQDRLKTEFLSNVSHELKTPIALIQGYAEGILEGVVEDPEGIREYSGVILDEAQKMGDMVKHLLELNQIELGKAQVELERLSLFSVLKDSIDAVKILLEQNEIQCRIDCNPDAYVWGDRKLIDQVLINYLSNAIHFCEGEKRIEVSACKLEQKYRISVFNTGDSIPEADLERVWEKFYKVDKARTRDYGGNGIGLSIVKASMEQMQGAYGAENREQGVVFWFELETA